MKRAPSSALHSREIFCRKDSGAGVERKGRGPGIGVRACCVGSHKRGPSWRECSHSWPRTCAGERPWPATWAPQSLGVQEGERRLSFRVAMLGGLPQEAQGLRDISSAAQASEELLHPESVESGDSSRLYAFPGRLSEAHRTPPATTRTAKERIQGTPASDAACGPLVIFLSSRSVSLSCCSFSCSFGFLQIRFHIPEPQILVLVLRGFLPSSSSFSLPSSPWVLQQLLPLLLLLKETQTVLRQALGAFVLVAVPHHQQLHCLCARS